MGIWIIFLVSFIPAIYFIWKINKHRHQGNAVAANGQQPALPPLTEQPVEYFHNSRDEAPVTSAGATEAGEWWSKLNSLDQLHLALMLTLKALPVWEKFTFMQDASYRNSSTGPLNKVDSSLLRIAITEFTLHSGQHFPAGDNKIINLCYNDFIEHVVALHDGVWITPYPVKKIFLAVYYMLKSIVEQSNIPVTENYLATSINQSLDCMEMTKLYSREEIAHFLAIYKNKV